MSYNYIDGNRFDSLEDAVEHIIKDLPCDRSKILREYISNMSQTIEKMKCCENCAYRTVDLLSFKPFCDKRKLEIENPLTYKCDKWKSVN